MNVTRNPVEILRSRTMPVWPLWALVAGTFALHIAWLWRYAEPGDAVGIEPEVAAAVIALAVWGWYHSNRRDVDRSSLKRHGWQYSKASRMVQPGRFTAFPRPRTKAAAITHAAWGSFDNRVFSSYTLWTSKVHRYSVERVELPADLPPIVVVPRGWVDRVIQSVEFAPFAVESADFNDRWRVVTNHAREASAVLHPRMLELLLSGNVPPGIGVTFDDGAVLLWSPGRVRVEDIPMRVAVALDIAELVPEFGLTQFGESRADVWGPATMDKWVGTPEAAAVAREVAAADAAEREWRAAAAAALQVERAKRDKYFASPQGRPVLAEPDLFYNGAQGVMLTGLGLVATVFLGVFSLLVQFPIVVVGVLMVFVGVALAAVNARRISGAGGVGFWTAVGWMLSARSVRRR
jgi:hypothetical protein